MRLSRSKWPVLFLGLTVPAWAQAAATPCTSTLVMACADKGAAKYPNLVQCGDFKGWANLAGAQPTSDMQLYPTPLCASDTGSGDVLGQCYYDSDPHSKNTPDSATLSYIAYQALQTDSVDLFNVNLAEKGCSKAGIPLSTEKGQPPKAQAFCTGLITCRGGTTHLKVCHSSGDSTCPPADECEKESTYTSRTDTKVNLKDQYDRMEKMANSEGSYREFYAIHDEAGTEPQVVSDQAGHQQCFEYLNAANVVGETTEVATSPASGGKCPKLKSVVSDSCMVPNNGPVAIQSYEGGPQMKPVPVYDTGVGK